MHDDLEQIQRRTFAGASGATRWAYAADQALTGPRLATYLDRRSIAVVSSARPDGRPHSALSSYVRRGTTFWLPTTAGTVRERNLAAEPWLVLVVAEGDGNEHIAVIVEGRAEVSADVPAEVAAAFPQPWVAAWLRLDAERILSYADEGTNA
jgi:Pyridoxamine 5'-phosphate oxidase